MHTFHEGHSILRQNVRQQSLFENFAIFYQQQKPEHTIKYQGFHDNS